jgi:predicted lipid-binding transport protein (Tim44 family)
MHDDQRYSTHRLAVDHSGAGAPSLWQRVLGGAVMLGVFALALTVSVALFAIVLTVGVIAGGVFWWKTRDLRKAMREQIDASMAEAERRQGDQPSNEGTRGVIIEGEVVREVKVDNHDTERAPK